MSENEPSDAQNDTWPSEWDPELEDLRWVPPGAALPALIALPTHTAAVQEANRLLKSTGFAITIERPLYTKPSRAKPTKTIRGAVLRCAQGRKYTPTSSDQRKQSSRMTGCDWKGRMRWEADEEGNGASAGWQFTTEEPRHNHPASGELALPQFRKRNEYAIQRIKLSMDNRDSAMKILRNMRLSSNNIRLLDVSNKLSKLRRDELSGRTRIKALVDFLEEYSCDDSGLTGTKFYSNITKDSNN